ncbi:DUF3987 domain-containing protein [Prevotella stercorea]|uniref:DUF3987 domain-containing protein n=1 Tax=Leyella stercorea TaxID=363265 RepID=UPI001F2D4F21|nr:DUF3987 domain-containing protein [Leyella stercorea]MCF2579553.1 DUF3987 domain-containing protein [Leyella stercorea]
MSVYTIYYKDGAKLMRPVKDETEYRLLRDSQHNRTADKHHMVQMNYSCLPNDDGTLKGSTRMSRSVGMDIDFDPKAADYEQKMASVPDLVMGKKDELGLLMLERSANKGYHIAFKRKPELSQEENLKWASQLLGVQYDKGAKDITRVFFTPPCEKLLFVDADLFDNDGVVLRGCGGEISSSAAQQTNTISTSQHTTSTSTPQHTTSYLGIPYADIIRKWWAMYNDSQEPVRSNRNTLTFELAVNLRHICGFDRQLLDSIIPCYDGFPEAEKLACIDSALSEKRTQMPKRLKDVLLALRQERITGADVEQAETDGIDEALAQDELFYYNALPRMPQGVKDSIDAVGPALALPVLTAICPVIGMLATGVKVDVHGKMNSLNLISYIAGDFASGKGSIDPVVEEWTQEVRAMDKMYQQQEDEWRAKKRAAKNKKEQPEEPKLPVRCLTLNNTVANLAERLANTNGQHAFSFTPEADTVAQKWRSAMSDFSVMLRQAYDGTSYEREARSAEAVNVHIDRLLWNVVMCGTPDALYRVVTNYTDGFQSRIAIARTPDNTFTPLTENLHVLTERQRERIRQIAHLLPLMQGEVVLPKLEAKGRQWLEQVRLETMKNDDKVKARQRFRICPTTMRMMTCLMLCRVAAQLIDRHGLTGAETRLKQQPGLWKELTVKQQQPSFLAAFDVLADYQIDNALHFFRDRIEAAFSSKDYCGRAVSERTKRGRNDSIFERLDTTFSFEQALQHSIAVKGANTSRNAVHQMLKNWRKQGLIVDLQNLKYQKTL